jgi:undecaprenyl-diphosphatase
MSLIEAIVLGVVQGFTEFLPISSSGHLILVPWLFGWEQPGLAFDASLHLGTLVAVFVYFRAELSRMVLAIPTALRAPVRIVTNRVEGDQARDPRLPDARLGLLIALGSIPAGVAGLVSQDAISTFFHSVRHETAAITIIACLLIGFGFLLYVADRTGRQTKRIPALSLTDAMIIGLAQVLALLPGSSRSGVTLTAGLFRGMVRADAARFSFLLGVPLILSAGLLGLVDIIQSDPTRSELITLAVGLLCSTISGFVAISGLLRFLQHSSTLVFAVYRTVVGISLLLLILTNLR